MLHKPFYFPGGTGVFVRRDEIIFAQVNVPPDGNTNGSIVVYVRDHIITVFVHKNVIHDVWESFCEWLQGRIVT